jgi:broad specificity phosphatase PhoE
LIIVDKKLFKAVHTRRLWMLYLLWIYMQVGLNFLRWRMRLWLRCESITESIQHPMKQTLLIVRHGQTTWNVEHRLPGQVPGVSLNDNGRQQAARLAEALKILPISAIISSPLERAYMTAEYLAQGRDLQIQQEPELMDTKIGDWTGKLIDDIAKNDPAWRAYVKDPTVAPEGVETFPEVQRRAVEAVERWCTQETIGAYPAFIAHADVVKLLIAHYTGLEAGKAGSISIDNASVSIVEIEKEQRAHVVAVGWSPQPGWLKVPLPVTTKDTDSAQEVGEQKT